MSRNRYGKRNAADSPDERAARIAASQWGVVDNAELWACGLSRPAVMRRRDSGLLREIHGGVYAWGHDGLTWRGRCLAAVKACGPGAGLSYHACCGVWRLIEVDEDRPIDVTIPMRGPRGVAGVTIHRSRIPFEVMRLDGIPVTTPARALLDLASVASYEVTRRAVREAMARNRASIRELTAVRGRKGGKHLTRILADGYTPTRSELEDAVLDLIERGGIVKPLVNQRNHARVPDFRWGQLVVEADGAAWHDHKLAREDDVQRQAELEAHGFRVIRVTWRQVIAQPAQTLKRLRAAGAPAARRPPPAQAGRSAAARPPPAQGRRSARCQAATEAASWISFSATIRSTSATGNRRAIRPCSVCSSARSPAASSVARHTSTAWLEMP